ncbi:MAG: BamA/TamA family outer membrane protein [Bacteroidaceae bacterium]|nr:BamA/TamA family outer membrane protein [Bacteroidaceae bacterium]
MRKEIILALFCVMLVMVSCSSEKFMSENQHILTSVKLSSSDKSLDVSSYKTYIRQDANSRWFNAVKVPLGIYCMSGTDSTKRFNHFLQRLGEAPVIYDAEQAQSTANQLKLALQSHGYLHADVDNNLRLKGHKAHQTYNLRPGQRYYIRSINYDIDDAVIDSILKMNESESLLTANMPCDANVLDEERSRIINVLHQNGYYKALKKYIYYDIDTIAGPKNLALTLHYNGKSLAADPETDYTRYWIGNISVDVVSDEPTEELTYDSIKYRGIKIRYKGAHTIRPNVIYSQLDIQRGAYYNEEAVRTTYNNFSRLKILRSTSIHFSETGTGTLNCDITLRTDKLNQISAEIEGTNTSGDLGVASSVSFTNRNLFHGSEVWTTKAKAAFEAITGLEGYSDQNFFEFSAESRLSFPRIIIPFMPEHRRVNMHGSSEFTLQYNTQDRPEFHRRFLTALWSYKWSGGQNRYQHKLDAIGLNYVFMPWISSTFRNEYLDNDNARFAIVRHTYEDLFILNSSYNFIYNSKGNSGNRQTHGDAVQFHVGIESGGNLLYLLSKAFKVTKDSEDRYRMFNVAFAQYLKFDIDYARSISLDKNNTLAIRGALGLVLPYGNNNVVPYEKRYFAGGANSVRGWSVRELGPGSYVGKDGKIDFINQTGNLKLLFNAELRSYLFWKLSGALFVDAGNIWTTRNYEAQPGGQFKFDSFYKQIAASYGVGLRFNFDYFILRFDMAMKAISPSYTTTREHYPLLHPRLSRDFTFHFAVGLPF